MNEEEKELRRRAEQEWNREATKNLKLAEEQQLIFERAWAAGFFDGEGHASARSDGAFDCSIDQASKDFYNLERFCKAVGVGHVVDLPPRKNKKQQPACRWRITNRSELSTLFDAIGMLLTKSKRDQLAEALSSARSSLKSAGITVVDVAARETSENSGKDR
ncbi:LAGLIDADG family homing endonuclease [Bradyrhizobium sp. I71]|uniref:LAGLIDADG family homing endonuclease n=1 Tax=Bradyrhizobium sp. I71 TaxID=2590772 RepID=UPI001EF878A8|nr:LAGLIDADG family homing endonuclease [Bradyrhizobium sp. I71]ULL01235.1 hypothetical protein FJV43_16425 [Bradyrhizobium sp. I71]